MLIIILFLIVGSALVYISRYNLVPVTVNLRLYTFSDVPLFYVIVASVLAGLTLAYLFYLIRVVSDTLKLRGKEKELKKNKSEVLELTKRVHQLELENEKLKSKSGNTPEDSNAL